MWKVPRPWIIRVEGGDTSPISTLGYMTGFGTVNIVDHAQHYTQEEAIAVATRLSGIQVQLRFIVTIEVAS